VQERRVLLRDKGRKSAQVGSSASLAASVAKSSLKAYGKKGMGGKTPKNGLRRRESIGGREREQDGELERSKSGDSSKQGSL